MRLAAKVCGALSMAVFIGALPATAAAEDPPRADLQTSIEEWASEMDAPGMTAQVVDRNGVLDDAVTGIDGRGVPVDSSTPFVWGSVSKQITAATVLGLERRGIVDEFAPVIDVLPQAAAMLPDPDVTVGDLVHHTSGLPHDVTVTDDWTRRESASDTVASLPRPDGSSERGTFRYSSLNYLLLQAVVEASTGQSFADALDQEVLGPSGATTTITDAASFTRDVPAGHVPFFGSAKPVEVGIDTAGLGYGYLAGSIDDLGNYASWRLDRLQNGEDRLPEVDTGHETRYGHGLYHESIDGRDVWWHSGAVPGYYTYVAFVPAEDVAMVLATNRYGEMESERVAAVGRNLTTSVIDGTTTDLPGSLAFPVLAVLLAIVVGLVGVITWVTVRIVAGRARERTLAGASTRIVAAVLVGGVVVLGTVLGIPSILGVSLPVLWVWAPDVTMSLWILLGTVLLAVAVLAVGEVVNYTKTGLRRA